MPPTRCKVESCIVTDELDVHNVLWTGGWDSTFRVADLTLNHGRTVQPIYIRDHERRSTKIELATTIRLRDALGGQVKEPIVLDRTADGPVEVSALHQLQDAGIRLGGQYAWIPPVCQEAGVTGVEMSIHADDKAHAALASYVSRVGSSPPDQWYEVPVDETPVSRLFANFRFPLFQMSKVEMHEAAVAGGFAEIMEMTWFCHRPTLKGTPCGLCSPCVYTREEGLGRRVPRPTRTVRAVDFGRRVADAGRGRLRLTVRRRT